MLGRQARLPVNIMFGTDKPDNATYGEYTTKLKTVIEDAFHRVRERVDGEQQRQELYDSKCHGKPFQTGDLVWLHSNAVPRGKSKKLHHPWNSPWRRVKRLSDAVYRLQGLSGCRRRVVVHFDWLKTCHPDIRWSTDSHSTTQSCPSKPSKPSIPLQSCVGTNLEIYVNDLTPPQCNPLRSRQPPDCYTAVISN